MFPIQESCGGPATASTWASVVPERDRVQTNPLRIARVRADARDAHRLFKIVRQDGRRLDQYDHLHSFRVHTVSARTWSALARLAIQYCWTGSPTRGWPVSHPSAAEPVAASIAEHEMTLRAVLFHQQRLDEFNDAASHHQSASPDLDALDLPRHHQFVGPGPT